MRRNIYDVLKSGSVDLEREYSRLYVTKCTWFLRKDEELLFDKYSFKSLELLICRYYGYIPRVKFEC